MAHMNHVQRAYDVSPPTEHGLGAYFLWQRNGNEIPFKHSNPRLIQLIYLFIQIIPQGGLPRGRCKQIVQCRIPNSMCHIDLLFQQNGFQTSLVEQLASAPNLLPYS